MRARLASDLRTIRTLAVRSFAETIQSLGIYVALSIIVLSVSLTLLVYQDILATDYVLVLSNPFSLALVVAAVMFSIYLGALSCISIAKEKETGTLFILCAGPVNQVNFILGHLVAQLLTFLFMTGVLLVDFFLMAQLTQFYFSVRVLLGLLYAVFAVSAISLLGAFLAVLTGRVRAGVLAFIVVLLVGIALQILDSFLYNPDLRNVDANLFFIGRAVHAMNAVLQWLSPFAHLLNGFQALAIQNWSLVWLNGLASILFACLFLFLTIRVMETRGVRPE